MTAPDPVALVERLKATATTDHERGCQGREYACTCGRDEETDAITTEAAAAIQAMSARIAELETAYRKRFCNRCGMVGVLAVGMTCGESDCPLVPKLPVKQKQWRLEHPDKLDPQGSRPRQARSLLSEVTK